MPAACSGAERPGERVVARLVHFGPEQASNPTAASFRSSREHSQALVTKDAVHGVQCGNNTANSQHFLPAGPLAVAEQGFVIRAIDMLDNIVRIAVNDAAADVRDQVRMGQLAKQVESAAEQFDDIRVAEKDANSALAIAPIGRMGAERAASLVLAQFRVDRPVAD